VKVGSLEASYGRPSPFVGKTLKIISSVSKPFTSPKKEVE
jgi:hypothetical protein